MSYQELTKLIEKLQMKMRKVAADLNFEEAAVLRDKIVELKKQLRDME